MTSTSASAFAQEPPAYCFDERDFDLRLSTRPARPISVRAALVGSGKVPSGSSKVSVSCGALKKDCIPR